MFSKKKNTSIYIPSMYVSRKTPGNAEGTHGLWGYNCLHNQVYVYVYVYIYIHIYIYSQTGTFIYPEPPNTLKKC